MNLIDIKENLKLALKLLWYNDKHLIKKNCNERSIAHHLAVYLKLFFNGYDVDCEYNLNFCEGAKKVIYVKREVLEYFQKTIKNRKSIIEENEEFYNVSVYPDIIVHKRNSGNNLLVIEIKKNTSNIEDDYDICKLQQYTADKRVNKLNYLYGAFLKINTNANNDKFYDEITYFQNGKEING